MAVEGTATRDGFDFFEVSVFDYGQPVAYNDEDGVLGETISVVEYSTKNRS